jgi:hypothetical protein
MSSLPETLRLCGEGVVLRDWRDADAPTLEPVCGEWDVCRFTSVPWTYSHTEALAWIGRQREKRTRGTVLSLAIVEEDADEALGMVNLAGLTDDRRDAELGYWLVPTARGRGLVSRAASVLTGWGFETLGWSGSSCRSCRGILRPTGSPSGSARDPRACAEPATRPAAGGGTWRSTRSSRPTESRGSSGQAPTGASSRAASFERTIEMTSP